MDSFGDSVADTTRGVARLVDAFSDLSSYFPMVREFGTALLREGNLFGAFASLGKPKPAPFKTPMTISGSTDAQVKIDRARAKAEADAAKRAKELLALTKKQVKSQEALNKKKKEEGILGEIAKRFDLERIGIAAALGRAVNEEERLRLELMQALLDEDVKRAIILEGQLIKAQAASMELANLLDGLDEMVGDPFADWPGTIARIQELLKQLKINVPIETLFAEKGLKLDQKSMTVTTLDRMDVDANNVYINGMLAGQQTATGNAASSSVLSDAAVAGYLAGDPIISPAVEAHAEAAVALADSELALAELLLAESGGDTGVTVNIVVEGTVIAEEDLSTIILDNLYKYQKAGQGLFLSPIAI